MILPDIFEEHAVFLIDAACIDNAGLVVSAGYNEAPDVESSRIYLNFDGWWADHDVPEDFIVSVAYFNGLVFAVGKNGLVKIGGNSGVEPKFSNIKGTFRAYWIEEIRGHISKSRATSSGILACGWGGQVYRLADGEYADLIDDHAKFEDCDLIDIDETSCGNIYAVGLNGAVLFFDGKHWSKEDVPTNRHFYAVRCLADGSIVLAGARGALYRGSHGLWEEIDHDIDGNFWAIESFKNKLYITCADKQMFCLDSERLEEVKLPADVHTYHLHSNQEFLLSCGSDSLLKFDGEIWSAFEA
jgi:hypothetical protein